MKINYSKIAIALLLPLAYVNAEISMTPPDAKPGECYARVMLPAEYEIAEEKEIIKDPSETIAVVPAEFEETEIEVEVAPESKKLAPVAAQYRDEVVTVEVKPAIRAWRTDLGKKSLPVSPSILSAVKTSGVDLDSAQPGDCFKEYFTPRTFKIVKEDMLVRNEYNETKVVPAQFETIEKTVVVVPATKKIIPVPAVYEEVEEQILVEPAKTVWKKGENPAQKVSGATGEIMCLVNVPARYDTIKKRILKTPATVTEEEIPEKTEIVKVQKLVSDAKVENSVMPAVYTSIEKSAIESEAHFSWFSTNAAVEENLKYAGHQICLTEEPAKTQEVKKIVLDTPASIQEEIVPPTKTAVKVQKLIAEAKVVKTPVDAEYEMVKKRKKISDTHLEWKRILCQTNMSKDIIAKIQAALNEKGYSAGVADGVLGAGTRNALDKYQRENSLATGGITYETLKALEIEI